MGGRILADSEPGKGSRFYVFLPFQVKTPSFVPDKADKGNGASASEARVAEVAQPPNIAAEGVRIDEPAPLASEPVQSAIEEHFFSFREDDTFHVLALQQIEESSPQEVLLLEVAETPNVGWEDEDSTQKSREPLLDSADCSSTDYQPANDSSQSKAGPRPSAASEIGGEGSHRTSEAAELSMAGIKEVLKTGPVAPDKSEDGAVTPDKSAAATEAPSLTTPYAGPSASAEAQTRAAGALEIATSRVGKPGDVVIDVSLLQRSDDPALKRQAAPTTGTTNKGPSFRILLVEDNVINQKVAARLLQKSGHTVRVVADGVQAVEAVHSNRDNIDLVLMDIQMPKMDGLEATRCIREEETKLKCRRRMPIVGLTAHAMQGYQETCLSAGMDGYLAKPFELNHILATITEIITRRDVRINVKIG